MSTYLQSTKTFSIIRVEVTSSLIRVYLSLSKANRLLGSAIFYLIVKNEEHFVLKGKLPHEPTSFSLKGETLEILANFNGNIHGGEVTILRENLPTIDEFFIQIEQLPNLFEESSVYSIHPKSWHNLKTVAVIPCYNASLHCEKVIRSAIDFANYIIAINDGSTDNTKEILVRLEEEFPNQISIVSLEKNCGKGYALLKGFKHALSHFEFDALITLDADEQHRPSDIPYLTHAIEEGAEMVIGERLLKLMPPRSRFGNTFMSFLLSIIYPSAPKDTQSGMRAFTRGFVKEIISKVKEGQYEMELECLLLALKEHRRIKSLRISTLYIDKNVSSHFSVLGDSIKIIWSLFKHAIKKVFS